MEWREQLANAPFISSCQQPLVHKYETYYLDQLLLISLCYFVYTYLQDGYKRDEDILIKPQTNRCNRLACTYIHVGIKYARVYRLVSEATERIDDGKQ